LLDIETTVKWHPIIYAICQANYDLVKHLISTSMCNIKKAIKVPGLYNTQMLNKIFPLVISLTDAASSKRSSNLRPSSMDMFRYFWEELGGYLWSEDSFECLFKLMARRELTDMVPMVFSSRTTRTIFEAMSFQYRFSFIEHLLGVRNDLQEDIMATAGGDDVDHDEHEEFVFERRQALKHFFEKVYESLS
jgi:hypothetical protein